MPENNFWALRCRQQAAWTREVRKFVINTIALGKSERILELGCAGGAILEDFHVQRFTNLYGLDIVFSSLPADANFFSALCADARSLPFLSNQFDFVYCHFFLLWVQDVEKLLIEVKRILRSGGHFAAFAEPDYTQRADFPKTLQRIGQMQNQAILRRGAILDSGAKLHGWFKEAGLQILAEGVLEKNESLQRGSLNNIELEVLQDDLKLLLKDKEVEKEMSIIKKNNRSQSAQIFVPTHYSLGRKISA